MLPVTKPYLPSIDKFKSYIDEIYFSRHLTNSGPLLEELEKRLKDYLGVKHVICVANGTLALQVAYKALELKGKVITTPFSFAATSSTLIWEGLEPVYCDIDKDSLNLDSNLLEELVDEHTSCILPVHVFGNACEVEKISKFAKRNNLKVIYDAAHAFSVEYFGRSLLSYGDISTVSFHATKIFHTIEGGAIITESDEIADKVRKLINFGISNGEIVDRLGTNAKMNEFEAAMGLCVLDDIEDIKKSRAELISAYDEFLPKSLIRQRVTDGTSQLHAYMPVIFPNESLLLHVSSILEQNEIYARRYFSPSLDVVYSKKPQLNNSQCVSQRILCLPLFVDMTSEQVKTISTVINSAIQSFKG